METILKDLAKKIAGITDDEFDLVQKQVDIVWNEGMPGWSEGMHALYLMGILTFCVRSRWTSSEITELILRSIIRDVNSGTGVLNDGK